ncbi:MAG: signal peptidase I [Lachnospiraceae bacterium]|jgi:signal peptidase I|nr:signal peptidase I [Lachnospiraceae bacterium]
MKEKRKGSAFTELKQFLCYVGVVAAGMLLLITFVVQRADVYGHSMEPTLKDGDILLVDKLSYRFSDPRRYDIIVFSYRYQKGRYYTKRIIGLPGETVQIQDGAVFIDGKPLEDDISSESIEKARRASEPVVLGEDEYFVLGDNRNFSSDSRDTDVGNVKRRDIIGRIWLKVWPPG